MSDNGLLTPSSHGLSAIGYADVVKCVRCDGEADREVTWQHGVSEFYCEYCMDEYHAGADEIDAHEARIAAEGCPYTSCCPRPTERLLHNEPRGLSAAEGPGDKEGI